MTLETYPYDPSILLDSDEMIAGALEDAINDPDPQVLPVVLRHVAQAKGFTVAELAEAAGLNRASLYRTLQGNGTKWATIHAILRALGIRLTVAA